jgi:uncharacterized protein with HEPN domain
MPRDYGLYLDDILEAIDNIRDYTANMGYEAFMLDKKTRDAVVRNLEIIGEAAGRLPEEIRSSAQGIEWRKIVGLRNILAHEYFSVSIPVVWDVVQNKLDPLKASCQKLLERESERNKERHC